MTRQKDLKRIVRSRMQKTGESYTAARSRVLAKKPAARDAIARRTPTAPPNAVPPSRYAEIAGMSDDAVHQKTGKTWREWVETLDATRAADRSHREIAAHVQHAHEGVSGWWAQTITVGYERIKGLRDVGQRRGGTYDANKSRTYPVSVAALYRAWSQKRVRTRWLPESIEIRTASREKSMRITWPDGTDVHVYFTAKSDAKSTVSIQHGRLRTKQDVARAKAAWSERLDRLRETL